MRQIWITKAGTPEVLQVREALDPEPKSGEVRIKVEASGVNFADILGRLGIYPDCRRSRSFQATRSAAAFTQLAQALMQVGLGAMFSR